MRNTKLSQEKQRQENTICGAIKALDAERKKRIKFVQKIFDLCSTYKDHAQRGQEIKMYLDSAAPNLLKNRPIPELYAAVYAPNDVEVIKKLFVGLPPTVDRTQCILDLIDSMSHSKLPEELEFSNFISNSIRAARNLKERGLPDVLAQIAESATYHIAKWSNWPIMPHCIEAWLGMMSASTTRTFRGNTNNIWKTFSRSFPTPYQQHSHNITTQLTWLVIKYHLTLYCEAQVSMVCWRCR